MNLITNVAKFAFFKKYYDDSYYIVKTLIDVCLKNNKEEKCLELYELICTINIKKK